MNNRRTFIRTTLLIASGMAVTTALAKGKSKSPKFRGIIYTETEQSKWEGKAGSHVPRVTKEGKKINVFTDHGMSEMHYIVRHTVVTPEGEVLGSRTFYPEIDEEARSSYDLPENYSGKLYVTSFCNKHDFWITEVKV